MIINSVHKQVEDQTTSGLCMYNLLLPENTTIETFQADHLRNHLIPTFGRTGHYSFCKMQPLTCFTTETVLLDTLEGEPHDNPL